MWADYKCVMDILQISSSMAYKIIAKLQKELSDNGYIVNPNKKVPLTYLCERFRISVEDAKAVLNECSSTTS